MRAVWTGSIGFGLVSIPVRLYPAVSPKDPRFHLIDRVTGRRIRNRRVVQRDTYNSPPVGEHSEPPGPEQAEDATVWEDRQTGAEPSRVPQQPSESAEVEVSEPDVVRGYEVDPGRHVLIEDQELEAIRPEQTRTIEIEHFVELEEIDPVYFEKSYHVAPASEHAEKPYELLRRAMESEGRVAIGRFVLRTREHLVAVRPTLGILGLETLYFADEVRQPQPRWQVEARLRDGELRMAVRLIEAMREDWDPARYGDPYRERILELIAQREAVETPGGLEEAEPAASAVPDLMAALKASVEELSKEKRRPSRRRGSAG